VAHDGGSGFVFAGFLPGKAAERDAPCRLLAAEPRAVVLLEAPTASRRWPARWPCWASAR
jgi:16S rRNA C1402 (ribose-2'-O) methylase RsmI